MLNHALLRASQPDASSKSASGRPVRNPALRIAPFLLTLLLLLGFELPLHAQPLSAQSESGEAGNPVGAEAIQATRTVFLPMVAAEQNSERTAQTCHPSEKEEQLAQLLKTDPLQRRPTMTCNALLEQVARARAEDMARRGYFAHTDPDGYGPNYHVLQAGYELPDWYDDSKAGNNVESIGGGYATAAGTLAAWLAHPPHNAHPFGLLRFYAEQTEYGIGHYRLESSPYKEYWVLITAPPVDD